MGFVLDYLEGSKKEENMVMDVKSQIERAFASKEIDIQLRRRIWFAWDR